ncbi:MAG: hypothetical protein LYZ70_06840 [Nitrososphaerales archaeon]|nr:hypothetical protein [Nitrososphaerales archaeon]
MKSEIIRAAGQPTLDWAQLLAVILALLDAYYLYGALVRGRSFRPSLP